MARIIVTQNLVRELLHYDQETGIFIWRYRDRKYFPSDRAYNAWNARYPGKEAGSKRYEYVLIGIFGRLFSAHRLAFLYVTGSLPDTDIDHKDRNRSNNAFENLRAVSRAVNTQNSFIPLKNNKLQIRGVRQIRGKKFVARIIVDRECHHLGTFTTAEEANAAYLAAKQVYHPGAVQTLDTA
jgi:hypothetical protein